METGRLADPSDPLKGPRPPVKLHVAHVGPKVEVILLVGHGLELGEDVRETARSEAHHLHVLLADRLRVGRCDPEPDLWHQYGLDQRYD